SWSRWAWRTRCARRASSPATRYTSAIWSWNGKIERIRRTGRTGAPAPMTRLGIFGGTFDPPHTGHLILAETAADDLALDRVLFVPAADPPHKAASDVRAPAAHRAAMVERAI